MDRSRQFRRFGRRISALYNAALPWLGPATGAVVMLAAIAVLWKTGRELDYARVRLAFTDVAASQLAVAALLTVLSYISLACYDAVALKHVGARIPYSIAALGSYASYALSFTIGYTLASAGAVRTWIYLPRGVSAGKIAGLTVIAGFTFTLGMGTVLGVSMIVQAEPLSRLLHTDAWSNRLIGLAVLAAVAGYLAWIGWKPRTIRTGNWSFELPGFALSLGQLLIGSADVCLAAGVLYVLLPALPELNYGSCLAVFIFAAMIGSASHVPGGLGAFEATVLLALSSLPPEPVLGSLLLFRVCYYLVPFLITLAVLALYDVVARNHSLSTRR